MFTRATTLRFAAQDTPPQLTAAFAELRHAVDIVADEHDADTLTEVFWAALHGLVTLSRTGRLRPGHDAERLRLLVDQFTADDKRCARPRIDSRCNTNCPKAFEPEGCGRRLAPHRPERAGTPV